MQSETAFPNSHQLKSYVASKSRLKLAARCPVSGCWPSSLTSVEEIEFWSIDVHGGFSCSPASRAAFDDYRRSGVILSSSVYKLAPEGVFADGGHRQSNVVSRYCPSKFPLDGCQCPRTNKEARGSAPRLRL